MRALGASVGAVSVVDFLLARIAEDEAVARQSSNPFADSEFDVALWDELQRAEDRYEIQPHGRNCGWKLGEGMRDDCTCMWPARVLAECEAKRQLIEDLHHEYQGVCPHCVDVSGPHQREPWPCLTVRLAAQLYADHPEFDSVWRP